MGVIIASIFFVLSVIGFAPNKHYAPIFGIYVMVYFAAIVSGAWYKSEETSNADETFAVAFWKVAKFPYLAMTAVTAFYLINFDPQLEPVLIGLQISLMLCLAFAGILYSKAQRSKA
jgi:hypothetical protein